MIGFKDKH